MHLIAGSHEAIPKSWSKQTNYYAYLTRAVHREKPANPVQFGTVPARDFFQQ
jgi:hypothetical protein